MKSTKTLLCVDTSAGSCTVGLVRYTPSEGTYTQDAITVMAETTMPMARGHAEHIMPAVVDILTLTNTDVASLDGVASTVGPGAFTGIRIALATAKGLCLPHKIPCIGVCNAHAIAGGAVAGQLDTDKCTVILETKRTDYYISRFENGHITGHHSLCFADAVRLMDSTAPITGDGAERFIAQWQNEMSNTSPPAVLACPSPLSVTAIAISALNAPQPPAPIYVRPPHVQPPKSGLVAQNSLNLKTNKGG